MSKRKLVLSITANYIPVILAATCYEAGAILCLMLLPLHILLLALNNHFSSNRKTLLLLSGALAFGGLVIGAAIVGIASLIMLILKKKPISESDSAGN